VSELESALLRVVAGHDAEDAIAALAAAKARMEVKLLRSQVRPSSFASPNKRMLTAQEVAKMLGVSVKTIYARKHELGFVRIGRSVRFNAETVKRVASVEN
jgi:excisionase family DNA binding protein